MVSRLRSPPLMPRTSEEPTWVCCGRKALGSKECGLLINWRNPPGCVVGGGHRAGQQGEDAEQREYSSTRAGVNLGLVNTGKKRAVPMACMQTNV